MAWYKTKGPANCDWSIWDENDKRVANVSLVMPSDLAVMIASRELLNVAKIAHDTAKFLAAAMPKSQHNQALAMMEFAALLGPAIERAETKQ